MKLKRLRLRNFRCYRDEISVDFNDFTAFIGQNDSGKSALLDALALFFNEYKPDGDDANINGNKEDMRIICEFCDLPTEIIIDTDHPTTLSNEWLLNQEGNLEIHRIFSGQNKQPKQTGIFAYAMHPSSENYADLLYLKRTDLQRRANSLDLDLSNIDQRVNSELRKAIWDSATSLLPIVSEIDLEKEDAKKIWTVLSKQLPVFAIFHSDRKSTDQDDEAQSPLKSAIDEAIQEKQNELDEFVNHVKTQVVRIANDTVEKIRQMDPELANQLNPRFSTPNWAKVFNISLTDDEQIPINKRGSGVRRLILLNFFRAKAESRLEKDNSPGIIYAIEEPETSQHPNNQKILISALRELSEQPGCQVIITTHTPVLVRNLPIESLRYIRKNERNREVFSYDQNTYRKVADELGIIPDHNIKLFIGVEGVNDIDFLKNISNTLIENGEDFLDLASLENNGKIIFIPLGGSNLSLWTHRLAGLNRPEFHLFDRDSIPPQPSCHQEAVNQINTRPNSMAMLTGKREMENYIHADAINSTLGITITVDSYCDVPVLVAEQLHILNGGTETWNNLDPDKKKKKISRAKRRLNTEVISSMTIDQINQIDSNNDIRNWLSEIKRLYKL